MDDWRVICPCQNHGGTVAATPRRKARRVAASRAWNGSRLSLLVGAGFVFMVAAGPADTTRLETPPLPEIRLEQITARMTPVSFPTIPPRYPSRLHLIGEIDPFHIGARTQEFLVALETREETYERVRREFFLQEVPFGWIIYREAKRFGLQPELVAAVVKTESDFRPTLISPKNARGLMQLLPSTGEAMGTRNLFNPSENIAAGSRYLRYLNQRFGGDQVRMLAAYNAGEGNVMRFGGVPPFRETQEYVIKVKRSQTEYQQRLARRINRLRAVEAQQSTAP